MVLGLFLREETIPRVVASHVRCGVATCLHARRLLHSQRTLVFNDKYFRIRVESNTISRQIEIPMSGLAGRVNVAKTDKVSYRFGVIDMKS